MTDERSIVDALVAGLEHDAEFVDTGALSIDATQALDKLGRHQLADPYHYVLRLAEAGIRLGADSLRFWTSPWSLVAQFEAEDEPITLPETTLAQLLMVLVATPDASAEREALVQLAVAANAARQLHPQRLWIESVGGDGRGHRLMLEHDQQQLVDIHDGAPGLWFRLDDRSVGVAEGARRRLFERPERTLLEQRACWASTPIYLDDRRISHGLEHEHTVPLQRGEQLVGFTSVIETSTAFSNDVEPCVVLLCAGIEVERVHPMGGPRYLFAVLETQLARDLSFEHFARGSHFDGLLEWVFGHTSAARLVHAKEVPTLVSRAPLTKRDRTMIVIVIALAVLALPFALLAPLINVKLLGVAIGIGIWAALLTIIGRTGNRSLPRQVRPSPVGVSSTSQPPLPPPATPRSLTP